MLAFYFIKSIYQQTSIQFAGLIQGAAQSLMKNMGDDGLVVDGRKLFFEYRFILLLDTIDIIDDINPWQCFHVL